MPDDDKRRLKKTIDDLQTRFGPRSVRRMGEGSPGRTGHLATGFPALDGLLNGGLPRGRITEIGGAPTAGIVTLALRAIARAQAQGDGAVYLDLEQTFDPVYAARCGVALERLLLVRPGDGRQACALLRDFAGSERSVLVCDLPPATENGSPLARLLPETLGYLLAPLDRSLTTLLCLVPQLPGRAPSAWQLPLRHYAALRLLLRRERWLHRGQDVRGYQAQVHVLKNKNRPELTGISVEIDVTFDAGTEGVDE